MYKLTRLETGCLVFDTAQKLEIISPKKIRPPKAQASKCLIYLLAAVFGITRKVLAKNADYDLNPLEDR